MKLKANNNLIIFSLETSCDETSAAVIKINRGKINILSNIVSSQINIHKKYGGVVPEVAARHHLQNIIPVIKESLSGAQIRPSDIDLMAVTAGPGLITSLMVGVETAKALSWAWQKPLLAVNHMYAHLAANFSRPIKFPALCLVVSGGHTELILLKNYWQYQKIGQTLDDAAGEAFDKAAKLLGLGYPGGPAISANAARFSPLSKGGRRGVMNLGEIKGASKPPLAPPWKGGEANIVLPRPMMKSDNFDFSFSGLKTALLYAVKKMSPAEVKKRTPEICHEFQEAAIEVLVSKTIKAAKKFNIKTLMLAGGVAANQRLREAMKIAADKNNLPLLIPDFSLCTDNAAMIAVAGYYLAQKSWPKIDNWKKIKADPNWELA